MIVHPGAFGPGVYFFVLGDQNEIFLLLVLYLMIL